MIWKTDSSDGKRQAKYKIKASNFSVDDLRHDYVDYRYKLVKQEGVSDKGHVFEISDKATTLQEGQIKRILAQDFNKSNGIVIDQEPYIKHVQNHPDDIANEVANFYIRGGTDAMPRKSQLNTEFPTFQVEVEKQSLYNSEEIFHTPQEEDQDSPNNEFMTPDSIDIEEQTFEFSSLELFLRTGDLSKFLDSS
jgi:hypothetical protein